MTTTTALIIYSLIATLVTYKINENKKKYLKMKKLRYYLVKGLFYTYKMDRQAFGFLLNNNRNR